MENLVFVEIVHSLAGLAPRPEIVGLRQGPFDKLRKQLSEPRVIDLTRLYFGLKQGKDGAHEWFREGFAEADPSFTMVANEREAAVLASCLLAAACEDNNVTAMLAVVVGGVMGNRPPVLKPTLITDAQNRLNQMSINARTQSIADILKIKLPASKVPAAVDSLLQGPDWQKLGPILTDLATDSSNSFQLLTKQLAQPLVRQICILQEEVEMLWWYIGEWSRILDRPFRSFAAPMAAVLAGIDLASLTSEPPGPVAAPAILHRVISAGRNDSKAKTTLKAAVKAFSDRDLAKLDIPNWVNEIPDICPVLTAFHKVKEIGSGTAWYAAFRRDASAKEDISFGATELAVQVYRESMLVGYLERKSQ